MQPCVMFSFLCQEMNVEDLKYEPPTPDGRPAVNFRVHAVDLAKKSKSTKLFETTAQFRQLIKFFLIFNVIKDGFFECDVLNKISCDY
jgi:hypothetical protein